MLLPPGQSTPPEAQTGGEHTHQMHQRTDLFLLLGLPWGADVHAILQGLQSQCRDEIGERMKEY